MSAYLRLATASLLGSLLSTAAFAQAVDYATLQETIGEPVTTSVIGKPQRASETPASIEIITLAQIRRSPSIDLPGLLKSYAGIDVNRWTAGQSDVSVRGGARTYNPRLLVLVNGRQVYLDHYGMTDWNLLGVDVGEIQQIELVRGPATALFGFNAASAVVNIITIAPTDKPALNAVAETGTLGHSRYSLAATAPIGKAIRVRIGAGHQRDDERTIPATQQQPDTLLNVRRDQVNGTVEITPDTRTRLTFNSGYAENEQLELLPSQYASRQRFSVATAGARLDRDTSWGSVTANGYANWLDAAYGVDTGGNNGILGTEYDLKNRIIVGQASSLIRLGLNDVARIGVEYRDNQLRSASIFSPKVGYTVLSGSAMLDLHATEKLAISVAARIDRLGLSQSGAPAMPSANLASDFDRQFVRGSFNAALLLQIDDGKQLRVNGGLGYQIPSITDFGVHIVSGAVNGLPLVIAGDPSFKPSALWSGEIGYSQRVSDLLSFNLGLFYNQTKDTIGSPGDQPNFGFMMIDAPALVGRFGVAGNFRAMGAEISADGKFNANFSWRANYTFTDTASELASFHLLAVAPEATTARHKANLELSYRTDKWFATSVMRYTSPTQQLSVSRFGQMQLHPVNQALAWDQKIGVRVGSSIVFVSGENLTKASGAAGSPVAADRRLRAGITLSL